MSAIDTILDKLANVRQNGSGWKANCPAHEDRNPSLSISTGDDGRVLLKCHRGCEVEQIVATVGLSMGDLFERRDGRGGGGTYASPNTFEPSNGRPSGLTLEAYAAGKKLPESFLAGLGLTTVYIDGVPAVRMPYPYPDGTVAAVQFRLALEKPASGPDGRFRWKSGSKALLYGLNRLAAARQAGYLALVEGVSDTQTAWLYEIPAVGLPGASIWRDARDADHLDGIERINVVVEPDQGGEAVIKWLATSRIRERAWLVDLGEYKDLSGLHLADPDRFLERWQAAIDAARPWTEREDAERRKVATAALADAGDLPFAPDLLDRIGQVMAERGYAGDLRPPKLGYVAMTSRLLERPQNLAYIAPSSAGKNRAVDAPMELMPPEAVYLERAGSARALIYGVEDFQNRAVVVGEADSIPEDGPAASAIRSLAADNEMAYDVVEQDPETGQHVTRRIRKPGPTGLITTSTRSLGTQMGTRMLEVPVPDDAEQTRKVLAAHADSVMPGTAKVTDLGPFIALQRWLALGGERRVAVPFAAVLADLVPATAVRMRRDFRQLLTTIQAVALLYQRQRWRTAEGWIVATIEEDYAQARDLLAPIFDSLASEGVTPAIRETVEAVKQGEEVTEAALADRMRLAKSTVSSEIQA
jgi:hypothetical protein